MIINRIILNLLLSISTYVSSLTSGTYVTSVTNIKIPICVNCIHFIKYSNNYPFDELPSDILGRCNKFGEPNLVTGEIKYELAIDCRTNKDKCSKEGKYFHPK